MANEITKVTDQNGVDHALVDVKGRAATVDLLKDTTGWTGKNFNKSDADHIFVKGTARTYNFWFGKDVVQGKKYTVSFDVSDISGYTGNNAIGVRFIEEAVSTDDWYVLKTATGRVSHTFTARSNCEVGENKSCVYMYIPNSEGNDATITVSNLMFTDADVLDQTYEPYHESVEDWYWSENAKTGVHNFVLGSLSGYSLGAQGNIYADATYDLHFGIVTQGESYIVTTDDSAGFVGGYFTSMPTPSSVTYNSSKVVSANKTFTAPIDGYVVFRTTHNYATPMFCLADDSYDGYTKGAMTNTQLTVGKMSIGRLITSADDLDTIFDIGIYRISTAPTHSPENAGYCTLEVLPASTSAVIQRIQKPSLIYARFYNTTNQTWESWCKFTGTVVS